MTISRVADLLSAGEHGAFSYRDVWVIFRRVTLYPYKAIASRMFAAISERFPEVFS